MADSKKPPSSKKNPKDILDAKEREKTDGKKWVRKQTRKNVEYKPREGGSMSVAPCWWDSKCNICEKKFTRRVDRDRHVREVHSKEKRIKCPDCDLTFSRQEYMFRHRTTSHTRSASKFKCEICEKLFTQQCNLDRHRADVHAGGDFKCDICPATYVRKEKLDKHKKSGQHQISFYCEICKKELVFKNMLALENHIKARKFSHVRLYCTSASHYHEIHTGWGNVLNAEEEKKSLIARGLRQAQDKNWLLL